MLLVCTVLFYNSLKIYVKKQTKNQTNQPTNWFTSASGPEEAVSSLLGTFVQTLRALQKYKLVMIEGNQSLLHTSASYPLVKGDIIIIN